MESGPRPTIDFDNLTNRQLYDVFIEAVKARDIECVKECIKRDGLSIDFHDNRVARHFAFINDLDSCEFLKGFDDHLIPHFISGALSGEHFNIVKFYIKKHNLRNKIEECVEYAALLNKTEILKKYWYSDQLDDFLKSCNVKEEFKTFCLTMNTKETTESLLLKYPKCALFIYVAREEIATLLELLSINGCYEDALSFAVAFGRSAIENEILPFIENSDLSDIVISAITSSDLNKVKFYFCKYKSYINAERIRDFITHAARRGEIVIANFLAAHLPKEEKLNYKELANIAVENNFKYAGRYFLMRHIQSIQHSPEKKCLQTRTIQQMKNNLFNLLRVPKAQSLQIN